MSLYAKYYEKIARRPTPSILKGQKKKRRDTSMDKPKNMSNVSEDTAHSKKVVNVDPTSRKRRKVDDDHYSSPSSRDDDENVDSGGQSGDEDMDTTCSSDESGHSGSEAVGDDDERSPREEYHEDDSQGSEPGDAESIGSEDIQSDNESNSAPPAGRTMHSFFGAAGNTGGGAGSGLPQRPPSGAYRTTEGGVGVEVYPDSEAANLDPEMINMIVGKIASARTTYVPCMLPEDEKDAEEAEEIRRRAEEEGEVDDGYCPVCAVGDDGRTEASSNVLMKISKMEANLLGSIPDSMLRSMKVDAYNKHVYDVAVKVGRKNAVKWTVFKMYLHEKRCNEKNFVRAILDNVKVIRRDKKFLRTNKIFTKASVGDCLSDTITLDYKASQHWLQLCREEIKYLTILNNMEDASSSRTGPKGKMEPTDKKKGNSYGALKEQSDGGIYFANR